MNKDSLIYISGHTGMVGSSILRLYKDSGFTNMLTANSKELDLTDQSQVFEFFSKNKPEYVILAAAKVGGIQANINSPAQFLYENLQIQNNIIQQSYLSKVKKICFLGSSCIYPCECPQPMKEEYLLTGRLEPTNEGYALAKLSGLKLIEFYNKQYGLNGIVLNPCNVYGTNDHYGENSHVLSAMVKRFVDAVDAEAKEIVMWGTGIAKREFMHVDDVALSIAYFMQSYDKPDPINVGWGEDISIKELSHLISELVGYEGIVRWDESKPSGMLKKCMDVTKMSSLGFKPKINIRDGICKTILEYRKIKESGVFG